MRLQSRQKRSELLEGVRDVFPVVIATTPFAMAYGALAAQQGLTFSENLLMSGLVYAGASQFVAVEFWRDPLPFWTILLSVLAVNLRHVLYSAAIGRRMADWPPLTRYAGFALLVDASFALGMMRTARLSPAYYFGLSVPIYLNWVLWTALGALFGAMIARPEAIGLDFVVTAYFLGLVVSFRKRPNAVPVILVSAAGSVLAFLTAGSPWHFAGGAIAGMAAAALLAKPREAS